ncbi:MULTISPECIES: cell division protein FtsA [Gemmobacter]|uniref:Cell division protein FtsA n=2 Tax=Gemmobacter TaxID=204456 RepID=A0A2T6B6Y0_9RHOB|nr:MULTISPECIES: cell division protein FtsA [Gemmobacter]OJY33677.1 MAG: cell division protein FtsA [Rhodobacterales bacterium 65-51]PTX51814.1 cell division protein FtsA [Gemmobacter caeni]TWJ03942.1 cell division protein FtsA [Gemmobacter caeni]GHC11425.1 cell division protein FtsA [Gemmobacter nanjingensis]
MTDLYHSQRAMRNMRRAAMQRGVVAILDIGSSKIACLVLRFDGPERRRETDGVGSMAGQSQFRIIGAATTRSRGVRFGEIHAMNETERAIRTAVQAAQKMANVRVDHVIACFSGAEPRSYGLAGEIELADSVVTEHDVARALAACDMPDIGQGREVLHAQPVNFALDHRTGMGDPRGQIGNRLACDMHLLSVEASVVQNLFYCINRCDLEVAGIASSAYVSGISSLVEDEQELGAACIDMGGGSTGISIFIKKHMIYADSVRMGGDHITSDIAKGLQVPMTVAERIKTKHGGVHATSMDDREMIEIGGDSGDWEKDRRQVSRTELIGIIRPRVEEILEEARVRLDAAGFEHLPSQQIVLTGGASQIPGLDGLAARILGQRVRLGRPLRIQGLPQAVTGPAFSSSVGLCLFATHPQDEWWDFDIPAERYPARSLKRAIKWFRDNW